jgi:multidrug efflux pump subunit AcrA (membrane-fusion protein)
MTAGNEKKSELFRKEAFAKLDALDELDRLVTVTRPRAWLALGAVGLLIVAALIWAVFGSMSSSVDGSGILLRGGRILQVASPYSGQVKELLVGLGNQVTAGQPIATLLQPELSADVKWRTAEVERLRGAAQQQDTAEARQALAAAEEALRAAQAALAERSMVLSTYTGSVTSIQVFPGQFVTTAAPMLTVEPDDVPLVATLYVPDGVGKKMEKGMRVQVVPASVSVEQYGYLLGTITMVSAMPSSPESMRAVLQNDLLVEEFSGGQAAIRVQVALEQSSENASGYAWSSSKGPAFAISSGTVCSARVVLGKEAPITRVFPSLSGVLGSGD